MFYTIYKITNIINNKIYIGKHQTKDINDGYMGSGKHLKRSIQKYGIENFTKEILHVFNTELDMNDKEAELVTEEFCLREDTYNICVGGKGGFSYLNSIPRSENQKNSAKKQILINANPKKSLETMRKNNSGCFNPSPDRTFLGRTHSEETKEKMRKPKNVGPDNAQYGSMWITNGIENKKIKKNSKIPDGWYKGRIIQ